jgi:hypothetical protein
MVPLDSLSKFCSAPDKRRDKMSQALQSTPYVTELQRHVDEIHRPSTAAMSFNYRGGITDS